MNLEIHFNISLLGTVEHSHATKPINIAFHLFCSLQLGQHRCSLCPRKGEFGLYKDLLDVVLLGIELVVDLVDILKAEAMREHLCGVQGSGLNLVQQPFPVLHHRGLSVADEPNATLHQGSNVEVVGLSRS